MYRASRWFCFPKFSKRVLKMNVILFIFDSKKRKCSRPEIRLQKWPVKQRLQKMKIIISNAKWSALKMRQNSSCYVQGCQWISSFDPLFYMQKSVNSRDADVQKLQEMSENVEQCQKLSESRISGYSKSMTFWWDFQILERHFGENFLTFGPIS